MRGAFRFSVLLLVLLVIPNYAMGAGRYSFQALGVVPGTSWSSPHCVSDSGVVVGTSVGKAFRWSAAGGMTALGSLGNNSSARGVNGSGQIVGYSSITAGAKRACLWNPDQGPTDLSPYVGAVSEATAINSSGQIVGQSLQSTCLRVWSWDSDGGVSYIPWPAPFYDTSRAEDLNNYGQVVGSFNHSETSSVAYVWTPGSDPVTLDNMLYAYGVNDAGQVVGENNEGRAALWDPDAGYLDLGFDAFTGRARDINNRGEVIGDGDDKLFIWTASGGLHDLASLVDGVPADWTISCAISINDLGQITGYGVNPSGKNEAYLLTPVVPEPSSLLALGSGVLALCGVLRRRRK